MGGRGRVRRTEADIKGGKKLFEINKKEKQNTSCEDQNS